MFFVYFDFIANHLAGLEPTIRSSGEDVLPNIYCGVGTIILSFIYLYIKKIPLREKISRILLLVTLFLSFDINTLNYIWHGFHFPNDLPYRFSFIYSFVLLTVAFKALLKIREIKGRELLNIGIGMSIFIILVDEIGSKNVTKETIIISLIFVIIYTLVLSLLENPKFQASAVASLLFCCMFAEATVATTNHYDIDQPKTAYTSDYNSFISLKDRLDKAENNGFYRMELTDLRTRMDPSWYGYNGVSTFSSMAYEKAANLQFNLGMFGNYINSYTYHLQTPVYNSMFALKYIVNNDETVKPNSDFYKPRYKANKFTAYENLYDLPLAYCVDKKVKNWDTTASNPFEVQADYFERATGVKDVFTTVPISEVSYQNIQDFGDDISSGMYVYYKINNGETASVTLTIKPEKLENLYIYLSSDNVDQITVRDMDGNLNINQSTDEEYILDIGKHGPGETIYIDVPVSDADSGYIDVYVAGLNESKFKSGYKKLNDDGAMKIKEFNDTKITGTVTANQNEILYTSINYDPSWQVYVDGEKLDSDNIIALGDALMGVKLAAGSHEVTFKYTPNGIIPGAIISIASVALLVVFVDIIPKQKAKKAKAKEE